MSGLQAFLQKLPPQQNRLNLPPDQQTALLGQLFQQMIQNQQLFLAVTPAAQTGASANPSASGGGNPQTAILQVDFSQIQADQLQEGNGQASQVFINLENFKMSATFIQEGQPSQLPGASQNPQDLLNALNQALAKLNPFSNPAVTSTGSALNSSAQNDLNQNFKNLVQLLMQSGVSQAALTSFMRHPQEAGNLNTLSAQAAAGSTSAANQTPRPALEIPPVMPTEATVETANNANTAQSQQPTGNGRVPQSANLAEPSITPNPSVIAGALKPLEVAGQNQATQAQGKENRVSPLSSGSAPTQTPAFIPLPETSTVNNTVDRLNAMAAQALITGPQRPVENSLSTPHGNVVQIQPQVPPANAPGAPAFNPPVAKGLPQNQVPGNAAQVQPSASARPIVPEQNVLNPREIAILNDTVVRMNASSLHTIQGSIGGNNTTPEINLTGGQILSSKFATDLLNPLPPTFGNPSVPITAPPPARQTPALNTAVEAAAGTPSEFQNLQNTAAPAVLSNAAQGGAVFSGPGINVSTPVQEPINQAAPLTSQAVSALPPVNPTSPLNNGASSSVSTAGSNNF
ncbi:MAG TPA: hypothetical protein VJ873_12350, partial [bacterium]|nr:hypothetical protein [bacterium]